MNICVYVQHSCDFTLCMVPICASNYTHSRYQCTANVNEREYVSRSLLRVLIVFTAVFGLAQRAKTHELRSFT